MLLTLIWTLQSGGSTGTLKEEQDETQEAVTQTEIMIVLKTTQFTRLFWMKS